jgi:uncharacterized protein YukE
MPFIHPHCDRPAFPTVAIGGTIDPSPQLRRLVGVARTEWGNAMDGIAISTERIATAGNGVTDVGTLLTREIGAMENLLGEIRSGWQSDSAAPAFAARMHEYLEQATQLKAALVSHGATLVSTAGRFAEAENRISDGMRGGR